MEPSATSPPVARVTYSIYVLGFFSLSLAGMMSLAVALWTVVLRLSSLETGLVLSVPALLPWLFAIHIGTVMDRSGVRGVMLVLAAAGTVLPLLYPLLPWLPLLFVLQMASGLVYQMSWVGAQATMGLAAPGNARLFGRFSFVVSIGLFFGPLLEGFAWNRLGPWGGFGMVGLWAAALLGATLALPLGSALRSKAVAAQRKGLLPDLQSYQAAARLMRVSAVKLVAFGTFLRIAASSIRGSFYTVYLNTAGFSGSEIGLLISTGALIGSLGALLAHPTVRFIGSIRSAVALTLVVAIATVSATPLIPGFAALMVVSCLYGVAMSNNQPILLSLLSLAVGAEDQGIGVGIRTTAALTASLMTPACMGVVMEFLGARGGFYLTGGVLLAAVMALWALIGEGAEIASS